MKFFFIDSLVDVDATDQAFQVASCFGKLVVTGCWVTRLLPQEALDLLCSGELLGQWC